VPYESLSVLTFSNQKACYAAKLWNPHLLRRTFRLRNTIHHTTSLMTIYRCKITILRLMHRTQKIEFFSKHLIVFLGIYKQLITLIHRQTINMGPTMFFYHSFYRLKITWSSITWAKLTARPWYKTSWENTRKRLT
jgi:hypothetical protein